MYGILRNWQQKSIKFQVFQIILQVPLFINFIAPSFACLGIARKVLRRRREQSGVRKLKPGAENSNSSSKADKARGDRAAAAA